MGKIQQFFCKHDWVELATRKSSYTSDYVTFSDCGWYNDHLYGCSKCGKTKVVIKQNKNHPLYSEWKQVKRDAKKKV